MSSRLLAGRYELLEKIGDGGMGVVYKAKCRLLNRFVAIKILKPDFTKDLKIIESFRKESQAAASLSHPNIVNVYDVGREGNIYYIVMELIEGRVLSDIIKEDGSMDYRRAIEIGKQMASALSLAHKNHIIHRDVKPHNILITEDGVAKITDFGIAKAVDSATIVGHSNTIMGSVHYFSPEQARGGYVDEKSDIYSLGIVLYELVTGRVPFDADNPVAVALMHINEEILPPSQLVKGLPTAVENIIMKATNKYSINRYASADEMLEALKNADIVANIVGASDNSAKSNIAAPVTAVAATAENAKENDLNNTKGKKPKKKFRFNKFKAAAAVLALVCAIPVSALILSGISAMGANGNIEVPDLSGMTYEEAEVALQDVRLTIEKGDEVIDNDFEAGQIISQIPTSGSKAKAGKSVTVSISKGVKEGMVPNIVGKSLEDALFLLDKYGFNQGSTTVEASNMPKDIVINQSPEAGSEVKPGATIDISVSEGPQETAPDVIGMNILDADAVLKSADLKVGDIVYEMSEVYAKGIVIWQQDVKGADLKPGTTVNLKVSTGTEPAGSKAIALDIDYASAANQVFYLTVTINDESGTHSIISREQRIKENGSEIVSLSGTGAGTVTVIFDNDVVMQKNVNFNTGEIQ
ncbi:MAG: Stk1 family PASTA domain-containing Ser/Thr kinase [Peptostreptococcaceae bacterium]|nr:Stk1 family PASTA domain-containing Ser/Thr kinase [Peptostreptococcaceae bacterium]